MSNVISRVNAVFVVKNEWPLLSLSVTHALLNYATKVIIIDSGSTDGTFSGIAYLQNRFPNRIELLRCNPRVFDQASLANIALFLSEKDGADWTAMLDADEFLYAPSYVDFIAQLSVETLNFNAIALQVLNFVPYTDFDSSQISQYLEITLKANLIEINDSLGYKFHEMVISNQAILQQRQTADKLIIKRSKDSFVSHGNHQIYFGDGVDWLKWDSRVASASGLGWHILHLPYTTYQRFENRINRQFRSDGRKNLHRVTSFEGKYHLDPKSLFARTQVSRGKTNNSYLESTCSFSELLSNSLKSTVNFLQGDWSNIVDFPYLESDKELFPSNLDLEVVSELVRKFFQKTYELWNGRDTELFDDLGNIR